MAFFHGTRPTSSVRQSLEWDFPGARYRPETRFFKTSGSSIDMTAASTFDLAPAANEVILVNRVHLIIVDTGAAWDDGEFGSQVAYSAAAGIAFTLRKGGSQVHSFTADVEILHNRNLFSLTAPDYSRIDLDTGNSMAVATWDFVGSNAPIRLDSTDDALRFVTGATKAVAMMRARADVFKIVGEE